MMILAKKAAFSGYGCKINNKNVYVSASLFPDRDCGIIIYDIDNKAEVCKLSFPEDFSQGNVYSCFLNLDNPDKYCYRFFEDEKSFADTYSKGIIRLEGEDFSLFATENKGKNPAHIYVPNEDSIYYLAHVKGLTKAEKSLCKNAGTFKGLEKKIPYLSELGITSLILMPVYESKTSEELSYREVPSETKANYWGFGKAYHFAIKKDFSVSGCGDKELSELVLKLHSAGIEVIFMMNFLDESPEYIVAVLNYYIDTFGADGFRLLGTNIPYELIVNEPLFSKTKFFIEDADISQMNILHPSRSRNLISCNNHFLKEARAFIKGDEDKVSYISYAVRENHNRFGVVRNMTDFSGFTLWDMVCYNRKHNEANGEENTDGTDYNYSWNCGEEGPSTKRNINKLRLKQVRNAMLLTCLCQGSPMLVAGDEILNSQSGNNNPYCQDNQTGWVTYSSNKSAKAFQSFVAALLAFRKRHVILHQPKEVMLFDYMSCRIPDVSFHSEEAFKFDQTPNSRAFGVFYCGDYARQYTKVTEPSVYVVYNMNWEEKEFVLPYRDGKWKLLYSTDGTTDETFDEAKAVFYNKYNFIAASRSITVFLYEKASK